MPQGCAVTFRLDRVDFDPFGRVVLTDRASAAALGGLFDQADAIACESGCGAPLSCDTALIRRDQLIRIGPDLLVNNADFATIIRKRKAVQAEHAVIMFRVYREIELREAG